MLILKNARIYTLNDEQPVARALLIQGDRIRAVGDEVDWNPPMDTTVIDLEGHTVLPGLTDAHLHLEHYALSLQKVDCETPTKAKCLRRVAERARTLPPDAWVLGHGWNQNDWPEGFGTARELDAVTGDRPAYLTAKSLHAAWVNSAALRLAGIDRHTPDPPNGAISRDAHGEPTGILLEDAMRLVSERIPHPSTAQIAQAIDEAQDALFRLGVTGVHDFDRRRCFLALQQLHREGRLRLRVVKNIPVELLDHAVALGLSHGFGDDRLRIGGVKAFADGALGPRTAAMLAPYEGEPDNRGMLMLDGEDVFEIGQRAAQAGLPLTVHAIGDRANHEVLEGYAQLRRYEREQGLPTLRHRIEHVQVLHPNDVERLAALGVVASMQPIHATSDMLMADRHWGDRTRWAYAWRTQLDAGAVLAFGSDAPVESPNPFWGLHAAVTRRRADGSPGPDGWHPEQRLSLAEALRAYTLGAAYAAGLEDRLGRLAPGYLADLVVLDADPLHLPPDALRDLHPVATMVGGEWVFR